VSLLRVLLFIDKIFYVEDETLDTLKELTRKPPPTDGM